MPTPESSPYTLETETSELPLVLLAVGAAIVFLAVGLVFSIIRGFN
jgi:hypothetical protein